jgi:hypothetical protein
VYPGDDQVHLHLLRAQAGPDTICIPTAVAGPISAAPKDDTAAAALGLARAAARLGGQGWHLLRAVLLGLLLVLLRAGATHARDVGAVDGAGDQ